ncbi:MAG: hypothetical protein MO846_05655 [Candidatus Devosia symbiotica]|nr:hypothetical protein [Candidatus Devosia symbiotica]
MRARRDEIAQMLGMELNRTEHASLKRLKASLTRHQAWLEDELKAIEIEIADLIANCSKLDVKDILMRSVISVGPKTAATILSYLPEIDTTPKQTAW